MSQQETVRKDELHMTILINYKGKVHLVSMDPLNHKMVDELVKHSIDTLHPTKVSQHELHQFLGLNG